MRDLARLIPVGRHRPDLRRSATVRNEINLLRIGRPLRALILGAVPADLARGAALHWHRIDLLRLGVLIEVDGLDGERHRPAVGGKCRLVDPCDPEHRGYGERLLPPHGAHRPEEREKQSHMDHSSRAATKIPRCSSDKQRSWICDWEACCYSWLWLRRPPIRWIAARSRPKRARTKRKPRRLRSPGPPIPAPGSASPAWSHE